MTHSPTKRARVITALLSGRSQAEAADDAGISKTTVKRWLKNPAFARDLAAAQEDLLSQIGRRLTSVTLKGIKGLEAVLDDTGTKAAVRVAAGRAAVALHLQLSRDEDRRKSDDTRRDVTIRIPMKLSSDEWAAEGAKLRELVELRAAAAGEREREGENEPK